MSLLTNLTKVQQMHRAGFTLSWGLKNPLSSHPPRGFLQLAQLLRSTGESLGTMNTCL